MVTFKLRIDNKTTKETIIVNFHSEIRWSHRKFTGNPEAKLYKDFEWGLLPFLERIEQSPIEKMELIDQEDMVMFFVPGSLVQENLWH